MVVGCAVRIQRVLLSAFAFRVGVLQQLTSLPGIVAWIGHTDTVVLSVRGPFEPGY